MIQKINGMEFSLKSQSCCVTRKCRREYKHEDHKCHQQTLCSLTCHCFYFSIIRVPFSQQTNPLFIVSKDQNDIYLMRMTCYAIEV